MKSATSDLDDRNGNPRAILDFAEFFRNPANRNSPLYSNRENRRWMNMVSNRTLQRDIAREIHRGTTGSRYWATLNDPLTLRMYDMIAQRKRNLSDAPDDDREAILNERMDELNRFGRNGPVGHAILPPPPPVPQDPTNYP